MQKELSSQAKEVLEARYLLRNIQSGRLIESPNQLFKRVAHHVSRAELKWSNRKQADLKNKKFYQMLSSLEFLPNSPTLMNAGTDLGQLSACFVIPVEDDLAEIFDSLKLMALIQQSGGGTGFSFSRLRAKGDPVSMSTGVASGPVSFMRVFDAATENIRQGGKRRGANMGILRVDHPDIEEFIHAKRESNSFRNFNLSVGVTDAFMKAVEAQQTFSLIDPWRKGKKKISAPALFQSIAEAAWTTGDPGLVFLDTINRFQPTPALGPIEATNPCGEVPLLPFEACNLGSINLTRVLRRIESTWELDWKKLQVLVGEAVRFLDDVIEASTWPDPRIEKQVKGNRKIGLGVMGFAEMLILLGVPYDSSEAVELAEQLMRFVSEVAWESSKELAQERGVFPNWSKSIFKQKKLKVRNATVTSIAPTGTISLIAGTSSGIEPLFGLSYTQKNILDGKEFKILNPVFEKCARQEIHLSQAELEEVRRTGIFSKNLLFRTALEISPLAHLNIQQAFQKFTDNAVSKTINLPANAKVEDIQQIYFDAWKRKLKGITVFRYGCKPEQVFEIGQACHASDCRL